MSDLNGSDVIAVSGNAGVKVPNVDNLLSSHGQKFYPTTSVDERALNLSFKQIATCTWICDKHILL